MNDEKKMRSLQRAISGVTLIFMIINVILAMYEFRPVIYTCLVNFILLLITITLVFDGILKDKNSIFSHGSWYVIWFIGLIFQSFFNR